MSIMDKCKDCKGDGCTYDVCMWNNQSYITNQQPTRDREEQRRRTLKGQRDES